VQSNITNLQAQEEEADKPEVDIELAWSGRQDLDIICMWDACLR
jgi:hypothetical protein